VVLINLPLFAKLRNVSLLFAVFCCFYVFSFCIIVAITIVQRLEKRKANALNNLGPDINDVEDEFSIGNAASFVYLISNTGLLFIFFRMR
jgi:hypothetical protein